MTDAGRVIGDYGIDSPRVARGLGLVIAGSLLVTVVAGIIDVVPVMAAAFAMSLITSTAGLVIVRSSRVHKIRERIRLVDRLSLEGNERVLDLGCGRGLLLLEVARRLDARGRATGVDAWGTRDGMRARERVDDAAAALLGNALAEGVERFDLASGDLLRLPFRDGAFDAVVSGLALHHVAGFESRVHVVRELARVLRVGGKVVLIDRHHTVTYVDALRACNFVAVGRSRRLWRLLPPARYVGGTKAEVRQRVVSPVVDAADAPAEAPAEAPVEATPPPGAFDEVIEVEDLVHLEAGDGEAGDPPAPPLHDPPEPEQLELPETEPTAPV